MNRFFQKKSNIHEVLLLVAGLSLYCALAFFFKIPCPIYFFTGISCPGCGMTRALFSLFQLDFGMAFYYHPLIYFCILMLPALTVAHIKNKRSAKKILLAIFIIAFVSVYLYRFLVLKSPVLKFTPENGIFVKIITSSFN